MDLSWLKEKEKEEPNEKEENQEILEKVKFKVIGIKHFLVSIL